jgi:hypothetical protein
VDSTRRLLQLRNDAELTRCRIHEALDLVQGNTAKNEAVFEATRLGLLRHPG